MIQLKRVYGKQGPSDGQRFLVERLWPRGMKKTSLRLDGWFKEAAPSNGLRKWFGHDPRKWEEFRRRYFAELKKNAPGWTPMVEAARRGPVTLLFSSHDEQHNNAVALREFLEKRLAGESVGKESGARSRGPRALQSRRKVRTPG